MLASQTPRATRAAEACPIHRRLPVTRSGTTPKMMPNRIVWLR